MKTLLAPILGLIDYLFWNLFFSSVYFKMDYKSCKKDAYDFLNS